MKMPKSQVSKLGLRVGLMLAILFTTSLAQAPRPEPVTDQETELGQEAYKQLLAKGEIVESSPLYESLKPIADAISRAAQPRYPHPFKFIIVHESQPNAFATPGGNVYVVDSLLYFVKNTEELAGTLCHEVSHTIHRDGVTLMEKEKRIERHEIEAAILLGPTRAHLIAIALLGRLHSLGYSREAESNADVTGSDICAAAGLILGVCHGCFKIFRMRTPRKSHSFSPTIPLMAREFKHWRSTSKTTPLPSPSSVPIRNLRLHSRCRKTRLKPFCIQIQNEEQVPRLSRAGGPYIK